MDELIGNLKTYEFLKNFGKLKVETKVGKNLVLKDAKDTSYDEDEETTYIAKRVLKALRKLGAISTRGESNKLFKEGKASDTCHKFGKFGHYIKDCPIHKIEYKEYKNKFARKEKGKDYVFVKFTKKVEADKLVN